MGISGINPRRRHFPTDVSYTLAARIKGTAPAEPDSRREGRRPRRTRRRRTRKPATIKVIAIADLDMISEQFFELRRRKIENLDFDNVTFVLNCVDVLAGDDSFVALRKKRPKHRTLDGDRGPDQGVHRRASSSRPRRPRTPPRSKLDEAQKAFDKQVDQVKSRTDLDERTKEIMLANLQEVAQRRLDVEKQKIEDEKLNQIREGKADSEQKTRAIENRVRFLAAAIPPLPPLILGLLVFVTRLRRENLGANPKPAGLTSRVDDDRRLSAIARRARSTPDPAATDADDDIEERR